MTKVHTFTPSRFDLDTCRTCGEPEDTHPDEDDLDWRPSKEVDPSGQYERLPNFPDASDVGPDQDYGLWPWES